MKSRFKQFFPVILIFIIVNGFVISGHNMLTRWGMDQDVMIIGNLLLFLITLLSFMMAISGLKNPNPHAFVRSVYSSIMLKLFACVIAAFIYISLFKDQLSKPALFACMGLYLVYTFIEVSLLMKLLRESKNG
ncbi:MAG TPA: hypothetical protein VHK91_11335 [Flavisolibacter sp.]|nr:hypothetical protein [Flavisolibacter sp.]